MRVIPSHVSLGADEPPEAALVEKIEEGRGQIAAGAFIEHELAMYHPGVSAPQWPISRLVDWIQKVGPERTVLDSDLGQEGNPLPVDAYLLIIQQLLDSGISAADVRQMICKNTAYLLGLEESHR